MNIHQLKILLKTSIPGKNEPIELTNSILNVPGTFTSNYPYFSPTMYYPHTKIQDMPYEDRIRFFFNKNTFIKILNKYNEQNNTVDKNIQYKMSKLDADSNEIYNSLLCTANFLFTIQTILPTGYTSDNHYQSIEFYDPDVREKLFTIKGSRPSIISKLLPRRYKANYSYIKDSNSIYTVDKVTWINDALNHPEYKSIVQSYSSGGNEKEKQLEILNKKKEELENKMEMEYKLFILKILLKKNKYDNYLNIKFTETDYAIGKRINNAMFAITKELKGELKGKEKPEPSDYQYYDDLNKFNILENITGDKEFQDTKLYNQYKNKSDDKEFWLASTLLTNETKIKKNSKYKIDKVNEFYNFFEEKEKEKEDSKYKTIKARVEKYLYPYFDSYSKFTKARSTLYTSNDISNHKDIMLFGEHVSTFSMKINAIKYKRDNASYTGDMDEKHIKSYLKEEFKNFLSKTQSLESLYNKYYITNPYWKNEIESYINESNGKMDFSEDESNSDTSKKGQFEKDLKKCYDNNSLCKVSGIYKQAHKYLTVGLDRLKNSKSDANILEAYLYVDVMKGKVTSKNYKAINCTYSNNKLGFHIDELDESPDKNNIDTPFYIDVTDELKKWESQTPKSTRKKKKRGGKIRTKTHKKK